MKSRFLTVSMAPHASVTTTTPEIMRDVLIALIPALLAGIYFFGWDALRVVAVACLSCVAIEHVTQKYIFKKDTTISDLSALVTGLLLAFNLPSSLPTWMVVLGSVFAIGVTKMCYGGLGNNVFNPALAGRVFLMLSFPVAMTSWVKPLAVDGVTGATPLGILKESLKNGETVSQIMLKLPTLPDLVMGHKSGCIGEVSVVALLLGFAYLLYRRVITWHIPVVMVTVMFVFTGILWLSAPQEHINPLFHIATGGLLLGAIFMATDYTTSPMTTKGAVIYAAGIGVFTVVIRVWGALPEGVSFAILIMNAFVPLINKYNKPYRFGETPAVNGGRS